MTKIEKNDDDTGVIDLFVMRYRCGWCGAPTDEEGKPLEISQEDLTEYGALWNGAISVNGQCCEGSIRNAEQYIHERMCDLYRDA